MTEWIPGGWHSVTARLVVHDVSGMVEFLKRAFDSTGDVRTDRPSQMRIGDSLVNIWQIATYREAARP